MPLGPHPDAIDIRLVFRIYAWTMVTSGTFIYLWPPLPFGRYAVLGTIAALIVATGMSAFGLSHALREQCQALELRTGVKVGLDARVFRRASVFHQAPRWRSFEPYRRRWPMSRATRGHSTWQSI